TALDANARLSQINPHRRCHLAERYSGAPDQRLQQHVASARAFPVAAQYRMNAHLRPGFATFDLAHPVSPNKPVRVKGDVCSFRMIAKTAFAGGVTRRR